MTEPSSIEQQRCYRHSDREAYISCQRCERLICPECMRDASVGFQCPECVAEGRKSVREPRTVAGGRISASEGAVSMTLLGINAVVFVLQLATGVSTGIVFELGAMQGFAVAQGDYWRLLTAAFLHAGILHIAFNMYALYIFGPFVERALGTARFVAAYLTMAVASSVFVYWLTAPQIATIGASGAVFGLFGLALVLLIRARQDVRTLLVLLAINAFISLQGNISWQGHLGGFVTGILLGLVFAYAPRERRSVIQLGAFLMIWGGILVAVVLRTLQLS
ncbi:rhomboid family intramembrane serine protease [Aeromicrobium sp.]|uniref:rhomboid family intramembrane serine protease n=1 Tax=Aeromicrobium sp. TaxID=1871063 RepID=UPI003D6AD9E3